MLKYHALMSASVTRPAAKIEGSVLTRVYGSFMSIYLGC